MKNYLKRLKKQFTVNNVVYYTAGVVAGVVITKYVLNNKETVVETITDVVEEIKS